MNIKITKDLGKEIILDYQNGKKLRILLLKTGLIMRV